MPFVFVVVVCFFEISCIIDYRTVLLFTLQFFLIDIVINLSVFCLQKISIFFSALENMEVSLQIVFVSPKTKGERITLHSVILVQLKVTLLPLATNV
jgi:hypothetical protein